MGDLERYGLLSVMSIIVLCLVLTFSGRDIEDEEPLRVDASTSRSDVVATLDPDKPVLLDLGGPREPAPSPPSSRASAPSPVPPSSAVVMRPPAPPPRPAQTRPPEPATNLIGGRTYTIQKGDTLSEIAREFLGSARRWPELLAENGESLDPRALQIGQQILIPVADDPGSWPASSEPAAARAPAADRSARSAAPAPAGRRGPPRPSASSHVVESGDSLSSIAHRYYGDAMQWRRIYNANRAQIPDARRLSVGTTLRLP